MKHFVRQFGLAALLAFGVAATVLAFVHLRETPEDVRRVRFQSQPPPNTTFSIGEFVLSPDGHSVAFIASNRGGARDLWIHSLDVAESQQLTHTGNVQPFAPVWSPDGRSIAFTELDAVTGVNVIKKMSLAGGSSQTLVVRGVVSAWSKDDVVLFVNLVGVMRVSASGGEPVAVTTVDPARREIAHYRPRFLPDGRHFLYLRVSSGPDTSGIYVGSIDASPEEQDSRRLVASVGNALYVSSSNDAQRGYILFNNTGTLMALPFDADRLALTGDAFRVVDSLAENRTPARMGMGHP